MRGKSPSFLISAGPRSIRLVELLILCGISFPDPVDCIIAGPDTMSEKNVKNPSFVLQKPEVVSYEDRPVPELKNSNDVIVKVNYTGICGSDVSDPLLLVYLLNIS
jgi:hypothetical protein